MLAPKSSLIYVTGEPSDDSSDGSSQHSGANKSNSPCPATAAPNAPQHQRADSHGNVSDTELGDQASEAQFASDLRTLARTPAFYKLLGLQEPPQCITHSFLEDFANRKICM